MSVAAVPILLFAVIALAVSVGVLAIAGRIGPRRRGDVKQMPYESGMDPIHDARRRFDVRFHLVAIAFLVFDVELLFLYPWAVANKDPNGLSELAQARTSPAGFSVQLVFLEVMFFIALLALGFVYAWRRGVFRWR